MKVTRNPDTDKIFDSMVVKSTAYKPQKIKVTFADGTQRWYSGRIDTMPTKSSSAKIYKTPQAAHLAGALLESYGLKVEFVEA